MLCAKMFLCTTIKTGISTRRTFAPENLCTECLYKDFVIRRHTDCIFFFLHDNIFARRNFTQTFLHSIFFSAQKPLWTDISIRNNFLHRRFLHKKLSAQSSCAQKVYAQNVCEYRRFYIYGCLYTENELHRNLCKQHTFMNKEFFHRQVLFSLLDHLPFVFPVSSCGLSTVQHWRKLHSWDFLGLFILGSFFIGPWTCLDSSLALNFVHMNPKS